MKNNKIIKIIIGLLLPVIGFIIYIFTKKYKKDKNILRYSILGICLYAFIGFPILLKINNKDVIKNNVNEWLTEVTENSGVVTILGKSTCQHCMEYKPAIEKLANKENFTLYFFELDKLSDEEYNIIMNSDYLNTYQGYVPYTFIISNGKKVDDLTGYSNIESIKDFLVKSNVY